MKLNKVLDFNRLVRFYSLSKSPILPKKLATYNPSNISQYFVDNRMTKLRSGNGGDGMVSFMRLKEQEFLGPDGGDGGNGGHVIFQVDKSIKSLNRIQSFYNSENGEQGRSFKMRGENGKHLIVKVPSGTLFKRLDGTELITLSGNNHQQQQVKSKFIAARGGAGGKGNHYYLSNDNRKPMEFERGHKGEEMTLLIELKLVADCALIGLPNAGKSSLLNALTNARPKIGDYSFTTLHPHVGVAEYDDFFQISIADFPGLLPDLSRGFGPRFLHHLERCKIIVIVIDITAENVCENYINFCKTIKGYNATIFKNKPLILVANKIDELNQKKIINNKLNELKVNLLLKSRNDYVPPIIPMSAKAGINLKKFLIYLRDVYEKSYSDLNDELKSIKNSKKSLN